MCVVDLLARLRSPACFQELQQTASTNNLDAALVAEALQGLTDRGHVHDLAVPLMSDIKHYRPI